MYSQSVIFPKAFGVAIDDLGWMKGSSLRDVGGPSRAGIEREMGIKDYKPIVEMGKVLSVRFQGLFVLSEMDRLNICARYPTITKYGSNFNNSDNIKQEQLDVMKYVIENAANLEFGLHGVGHEFFTNGIRTRAEWYDLENKKPWPEQDTREHLKAFKEIMAQYGLTKENGHSFPESFVPCAYGYYWNPESELSTGKLMNETGVKYANTWFEQIPECNPPIESGGGFDHGVLVINRHIYGNQWFDLASLPQASFEEYETNIIETHWPNWLAKDDFLQRDLNKQWIEFFKDIQKSSSHYLAKNTEQLYSQWLYKKFAKVEIDKGRVLINNEQMPDVVYSEELLGNMVLKVKLEEGQHVSKAEINGNPISAYSEDAGYGFIYLNKLDKKEYELFYEISENSSLVYINNTGTYNIYKVNNKDKNITFTLKMYGTQVVRVKCPNPVNINSENPQLKIISSSYNNSDGFLSLEISGRDIQGEEGKISIDFK